MLVFKALPGLFPVDGNSGKVFRLVEKVQGFKLITARPACLKR